MSLAAGIVLVVPTATDEVTYIYKGVVIDRCVVHPASSCRTDESIPDRIGAGYVKGVSVDLARPPSIRTAAAPIVVCAHAGRALTMNERAIGNDDV